MRVLVLSCLVLSFFAAHIHRGDPEPGYRVPVIMKPCPPEFFGDWPTVSNCDE